MSTITMAGGSLAPVIAGLAAGVAFVIVVTLVIDFQYFFPPYPLMGNQHLVIVEWTKSSEAVKLFLSKYPSAYPGSVGPYTIDQTDENGNVIGLQNVTAVKYSERTILDTGYDFSPETFSEERHWASLGVYEDKDGNIKQTALECGTFYVGHAGATTTAVEGEENAIKVLNIDGWCR